MTRVGKLISLEYVQEPCSGALSEKATLLIGCRGLAELIGEEVYIGLASESTPYIERDKARAETADLADKLKKLESRLAQIHKLSDYSQ